ncbi:Gfo/Idh/MocA family protein [Salsuginibacillus kocurii]|uniref:Gfo/Idh/MocA family protein n=1 Tax=Salsuginibacillus kocurii TaxID=427078 RepID=UPI00036E9240|nr:Gfo/Idh/MocA family oxidoreductase [Salsuginibacillus kocurii]
MAQTVKWGILSTAEIATKWVIPALKQANHTDIAAIASESGKEVEVAKAFAIPKTYSTYEGLLEDPEIDVVYIPLPNALHAKWVKEAAKRGKHVLCEKPAALTASEAYEMTSFCDDQNVLFMEAFMHQFHPQHARVREIIAAGEIGEVKHMNSSLSFVLQQLEGNIRMNRELGGGSLYDLGCYCIHAIRMITRSNPARVYTIEAKHPHYDVDMAAVSVLEMENGIHATFDCSMNRAGRHSYEIVGTHGKIEVPKAYVPQSDGEGLIHLQREDGHERRERIVGFNYKLGVEHFSAAVINKEAPIYSKESTVENMRVLEACHRSIEIKEAVDLHPS